MQLWVFLLIEIYLDVVWAELLYHVAGHILFKIFIHSDECISSTKIYNWKELPVCEMKESNRCLSAEKFAHMNKI